MRHAVQVTLSTTVTYVIETPDVARAHEHEQRLMADLVDRVKLAHVLEVWPDGCVQRVMLKQPERVEYLLGHPDLRFELRRE